METVYIWTYFKITETEDRWLLLQTLLVDEATCKNPQFTVKRIVLAISDDETVLSTTYAPESIYEG